MSAKPKIFFVTTRESQLWLLFFDRIQQLNPLVNCIRTDPDHIQSPGDDVQLVIFDLQHFPEGGALVLLSQWLDQVKPSKSLVITADDGQEIETIGALNLGCRRVRRCTEVTPESVLCVAGYHHIPDTTRCILVENITSVNATLLSAGGVVLDLVQMLCWGTSGDLAALTHTEIKLLELFLRNPGKKFTRDEMIDAIHGVDYYPVDRIFDPFVLRIRSKLGLSGEKKNHRCILTHSGTGYGWDRNVPVTYGHSAYFADAETRRIRLDATYLTTTSVVLDRVMTSFALNNRSVQLTPFEFKIMLCLMQNPGVALSRTMILQSLHGPDVYTGYARGIDPHILRLRRKLGDPDKAEPDKHVQTVMGFGYKLNPKFPVAFGMSPER